MCVTSNPPVMVSPLEILPAAAVEERVLANVGAFYWDRDPLDRRYVQDVRDRTGRIIDHQDDVGGLPLMTPITRQLELPEDPHGDADRDGYTNFEEWVWTFDGGSRD